MNAAVFLDRDNTLIHNDGDLGDPQRVRLVQGAASAIASLCGLGYRVIIVTNQSGVARGKYTEDDVEAVHQRIRDLIEGGANGARIHGFYYCPYHPEGTVAAYMQAHEDRKPRPGMLNRAASEHSLDLKHSWIVGDQITDVEAGIAAGTRTVLLRSEGPTGSAPVEAPAPDLVAQNLVEAVRLIAQSRKPEVGEDPLRSSSGKRWDPASVARLQQPRKPESTAEPADSAHTPPPTESNEREGASATGQPEPSAPSKPASASPSGGVPSSKKTARPFRPWDAPAPREEPEAPSSAKRSPASPSTSPTESSLFSDSPPNESASKPNEGDEASSPPPASGNPVEFSTPRSPSTETSNASPLETQNDSPNTAETARLLRQILQELRAQRGGANEDFTMLKIVAMVLQTIAAICLLGGLWMGAENDALYLKWLGAGLMFQGGAIAMLLFSRST